MATRTLDPLLERLPHRLELHRAAGRVRGCFAGEVVLDSDRAQILHETGSPPRVYVPLDDVRHEVLRASPTIAHCPFKGDAAFWSVQVGAACAPDALWTFVDPKPRAQALQGFVGVGAALLEGGDRHG